jgi:hypothetical protein
MYAVTSKEAVSGEPRLQQSPRGAGNVGASEKNRRNHRLAVRQQRRRRPSGTLPGVPTTCPSCGARFEDDTPVCRNCFFVIDRERWNGDAGRLGPDQRDRALELEDAPIGPVPVTPAPGLGGFAGSAFKLFGVTRILRGRRR